ncbi:hypothetical protein [Rhizobium calliandrae]|nr:hypothetical protein [Rhizobium calliandrae]
MRVCNGSDGIVLKVTHHAGSSDRSFDGEWLPRWQAVTPMISPYTGHATTFRVVVGFTGLSIPSRVAVRPSNTKLNRLLADARLENAALKDMQTIPPSDTASSDEIAPKHLQEWRDESRIEQ